MGALRGVIVASVAAANRHTVVATSDGRVYSWGSNFQGQLGYGTSDSASNATPRAVEAMKVCPQPPYPAASLWAVARPALCSTPHNTHHLMAHGGSPLDSLDFRQMHAPV